MTSKTVSVFRDDLCLELIGDASQCNNVHEVCKMLRKCLDVWGYQLNPNWEVVMFDKRKGTIVESD